MNRVHQKHGYILIVTLLMVAMATILTTYIFNKGTVHVPFMRVMIDREKARMLALGGIQLAMCQLTMPEPKEKEEAAKKEQPGQQPAAQEGDVKKFLARLLPGLNHWQQFTLKEEVEGIDGRVGFCISCEDGKININQLYDFTAHKFKGEKSKKEGEAEKPLATDQQQTSTTAPMQRPKEDASKADMKKMMEEIVNLIQKMTGQNDLFESFEKFLKERQSKLDDVTELLTIKEFAVFKKTIFFDPPLEKEKGSEQEGKKRTLYLTDIFTLWSGKPTVDPWVLSESLNGLLGLKSITSRDAESRKHMVGELLKGFKPQSQWSTDWNKIFTPVYGKDFTSLPKSIESILSPTCEPNVFSVLAYGKVGETTQKVLAIIQRVKAPKESEFPYSSKIKKIYWL